MPKTHVTEIKGDWNELFEKDIRTHKAGCASRQITEEQDRFAKAAFKKGLNPYRTARCYLAAFPGDPNPPKIHVFKRLFAEYRALPSL